MRKRNPDDRSRNDPHRLLPLPRSGRQPGGGALGGFVKTPRSGGSRAASLVGLVALLSTLLLAVAGPRATAARLDLGDPVALGAEGVAGPWRMTVLEVRTGQEATDLVTAASEFNDPPRDDFTYVAVRLRVTNTGSGPLSIESDDFAITGSSGFVGRFVGVVAPDDAIDGEVAAGQEREGWVILGAPVDEPALVLVFDSLSLSGNWADRAFALTEGATVPTLPLDAAPNDVGIDPAAPAGTGATVITDAWQIELEEVAIGDAVYALYPPSDYRTTALGEAAAWDPNDADADGAVGWLAIRVKVTSLLADESEAMLPPTAFMLAGADGEAIPNTLFLTPPQPDASGAYLPGVAREGWVAFELPGAYDYTSVRFLPYRSDGDARYLDVAT